MAQAEKPQGWDGAARGAGAWILANQFFDGERLHADAVLHVADGLLSRAQTPGAGPVWRAGGLVAPGFVDLQVNGGGGVLVNGTPTAAGVMAIARAHRSTGTAALLPTLITDHADVMDAAAEAVIATLGHEGIAGIHIEGPHIASTRKGTHAAEHVRPLDERTFACLERLRGQGVPTMITVAPEAVSPGQIARMAAMGVIVALGHSDATSDLVNAALAEGARTFTHLFNAMSQMQGREPGVVGAAINSQAYASFIADGIHVAPDMLRLAIRARPVADRMVIVTDAMPTVAGPDSYALYGQRITLAGGRLVNAEGALAGAHVTMLASVRYAVGVLGQSLEDALRMAITNPSRLMGLGGLARTQGRKAEEMLLIGDGLQSCSWVL